MRTKLKPEDGHGTKPLSVGQVVYVPTAQAHWIEDVVAIAGPPYAGLGGQSEQTFVTQGRRVLNLSDEGSLWRTRRE